MPTHAAEVATAQGPSARTGTMLFITSSGFVTPRLEMPIPDLPVPYAAPMLEKMSAIAAPMKPNSGASGVKYANSLAVTVAIPGMGGGR